MAQTAVPADVDEDGSDNDSEEEDLSDMYVPHASRSCCAESLTRTSLQQHQRRGYQRCVQPEVL